MDTPSKDAHLLTLDFAVTMDTASKDAHLITHSTQTLCTDKAIFSS